MKPDQPRRRTRTTKADAELREKNAQTIRKNTRGKIRARRVRVELGQASKKSQSVSRGMSAEAMRAHMKATGKSKHELEREHQKAEKGRAVKAAAKKKTYQSVKTGKNRTRLRTPLKVLGGKPKARHHSNPRSPKPKIHLKKK